MFHSLRRKSVLESGKIRFDGTKRHSLYLGIQDYAPAPRGRGRCVTRCVSAPSADSRWFGGSAPCV